MAIRDDFFTALTKGAKWDVGVSINRTNPLPLDQYSVFQSEEALDAYIAGAFSYVGQIVALVEESATTIYYIDQEKNKKPVGIIPTGDSKTIEVTTEGAISLLGASGAANGTLPMIDSETGKLVWKTLEDIGAGDGNDNTTYEITALENDKNETYGISIKTLFNGQPIKDEDGNEIPAVEIAFNVYTKSEINDKVDAINAKIGSAKDGEVAATGVYEAIEAEEIRAKAAEKALDDKVAAIDFVDTDELNIALEPYAKQETVNSALDLKANINDVYTKGEVDTEIDNAVKGILGEDVDEAYDTFKELQTILEGDETGAQGLIDEVATNKQAIADEEARAKAAEKANADAITILNGDEEGSVNKKIADAIAAKNLDQYATDNDLTGVKKELQDAIDEKATKATTLAGYGITDAYTTTQVDEMISNINQGNQESASAVNTKLENYKTSNDQRVGVIETKLNTVEENAEKNIIETVKLNGVSLEVSEDRSVDVVINAENLGVYTKTESDAEIKKVSDAVVAAQAKADQGVADALAAQNTANEAKSNAFSNTTAIGELTTAMGEHTESINDHANRITILENFKTSHESEYQTLNEIVSGHTSDIAKKASQIDLDAAIARISGNESKIQVLNETTVPAINAEIAKKANASNVFTKDEITAITGEIAEGKTLVQMISEAKSEATYDDTQIKNDIKANADAIAVLNGDDTIVGSVDYKVAQEVAKILNDDDSDIDTLNEIAAWIISDTTGAAKMNADIVKNASAIDKLNGSVDTEGSVLSMIAANAPSLATVQVAGLVKSVANTVENGVFVTTDGTMSVNSINVNKLVQTEGEFLVLNGGSAN